MASITIDPKSQAPTAQKESIDSQEVVDKGLERDKLTVDEAQETTTDLSPEEDIPEIDVSEVQWLSRSRTAYDTSTSFFDNNVRGDLDDSIRAFHSQHKSSSHYATSTSHFTSKVYRPKTRSVMMKYEAMADAAYFSNPDVISIEPENASDKEEIVSAAVMKALVQYRLTKTIPWYKVVIGGFQDAQTSGLAVAHYYWKVKTREVNGQKTFVKDEPAIDLIPLENIRFDPNANWTDVVETSPFLINLRPMYIGDIKQHIATGFFKEMSDSEIISAASTAKDGQNTRTARTQSGQDPREKSSKEVSDYEVCVVQEHIHRVEGEDYVWFTLNNQVMLRDPVPIAELYFTGERPYIIGQCILETHSTFPSSTPTLLTGIQSEINEIANQRLNNVKLALNKKFIIKTDSEIDLSALLRNQPGSAVFTQNPQEDVRELSTQDVTQSSYLEQDRLNADFDELAGNFSSNAVQQQKSANDTWRGMQMLNSNANVQLEHQLRIFTDTFVVPLLRAIVKLEQKYETDDTVFALVGQQNGQMLQRAGVNEVTSEHLQKDMVVKCNVGMNNTDPQMKQQKLVSVLSTILNIVKNPASKGLDMKEVSKELFALSGYGDGMRFINQEVDPAMAMMMQENMALKKKVMDKQTKEQVELSKNHENNQTRLAIASMREKTDSAKFLVDHALNLQKDSQQAGQPPAPPPGV
jgi:hypothetical protein